ncbi:MAG: SDR family NAD(P)-dependent oxidoreductase [Pseudomonadota bacterium]
MSEGHVLLTGALGGLGTQITRTLLTRGYDIVACDRRAADAEPWLAEFSQDELAHLTFEAFDVRNLGEVDALKSRLDERGVEIAYLINNAGIATIAPPWEMEPQAFDRVVQVNLYGTYHLTRTFCGDMRERQFGRIVNFASLAAYIPDAGMAPYSAAKAGIVGYTHSLAMDLATSGVTANVIAPGLIWHERLEPTFTPEERENWRDKIPMNRLGAPVEIAETVAFLMSDGAAYITGQTLHVNGGLYMT